MSSYGNFNFALDRVQGTFSFTFDYQIDAYIDPETFEVFSDTTWSLTYAKTGGFVWSDGGMAGESWSGYMDLILEGGNGIHTYNLSFNAINTFSAVGVTASWNIIAAAYETHDMTLDGTAIDDIIIGGLANDTLNGLDGNDRLDGGAGDDTLNGGAGADWLDGWRGSDTMSGGDGDDTYVVDSTTDVIIEGATGGKDSVQASKTYTLSANVEQLFLVGTALRGIGNAGANRIVGSDAVNILSGLDGDDYLYGGKGDDTLEGGENADTLDGGEGADTLRGGNGDDTYIVEASDILVETATGGTDSVLVTAGIAFFALSGNFENLETLGNTAFTGIGNDLNNKMAGGIANDTLSGKGGNDLLIGGLGSDILIGGAGGDELRGGGDADAASYSDATARVEVSLATGLGTVGFAAGDKLFEIENLIGSKFDDVLTGNSQNNQINGGEGVDTIAAGGGNDIIIGGLGADKLDGGTGFDTVSYFGSVDGVVVDLVAQTATGGHATGDIISGFENATGGDGNDTLTGNAGANVLSGGGGVDTIHGGDGDDTVSGGAGADWLYGDGGVNTISYAGSIGGVSVNLITMLVSGGDAAGDTISNFSSAIGGDGNDTLTGTDGVNRLEGGKGDDTIDGKGGNDWISGGAGADTLTAGLGADTLSYAGSLKGGIVVYLQSLTVYGGDAQGDVISGFENVEGSELGDYLAGNDGVNVLSGRAGSDTLDGGLGSDTLTGGADSDMFVTRTGNGIDTVTDFVAGAGGDTIFVSYNGAFDSFAEVMAVASNARGGGVVIDFSGGDQLILQGITLASLTADNFVFDVIA